MLGLVLAALVLLSHLGKEPGNQAGAALGKVPLAKGSSPPPEPEGVRVSAMLLPEDDPAVLYRQAHLVVKGRALGSVWREPDSGGAHRVAFRCDYAFKGGSTANQVITITVPIEHSLGPALDLDPTQGSLVLYLRKGPGGTFSPVATMIAMIRVGQLPTLRPETAHYAEEQYDSGMVWLQEELAAAAGDPRLGGSDRARALQGVGKLPVRPGRTRDLLRRFSDDPLPDLAVEALRQRIRMNDEGALQHALELVLDASLPDRPRMRLIQDMRYSTGEAAAAPLAQALQSSDVTLRRSASYALRHTDSEEVVPLLAAALADGDLEVAYNAVMGLARAEPEGAAAPAQDIFLENPAKYTGHWQQWWETTGKSLYTETPRGNVPGIAESSDSVPYDVELFNQRLAEARAYEHSAGRVRDTAVDMYRAALAVRPGHPDNIDMGLCTSLPWVPYVVGH